VGSAGHARVHKAVSATILDGEARVTRARPASPIAAELGSFSARTIAFASAGVIARRHEQAVHTVFDDFRDAAGGVRTIAPRRPWLEQRRAEPSVTELIANSRSP
jgi:hypothetical protein